MSKIHLKEGYIFNLFTLIAEKDTIKNKGVLINPASNFNNIFIVPKNGDIKYKHRCTKEEINEIVKDIEENETYILKYTEDIFEEKNGHEIAKIVNTTKEQAKNLLFNFSNKWEHLKYLHLSYIKRFNY